MSWEDSKACTPLKRDFLRAWFAREKRYFLTGGSALGLFYLDHRRSYDLDLFTCSEVGPREVQNLVHQVARAIDAGYEAIQTSPGFQRFQLTRGDESELVDVVTDRTPQLDPEKCEIDGVRVDTPREIIANKLATLLSRAETKDLVDLYFLEQEGHDLMAAIPDAREKDGGWEPAVVSLLLDSLRPAELPAFMIKDLVPEDLEAFIKRLRLAIAALSLPESSRSQEV